VPAKAEVPDFDLPDWSGTDRSSARLSTERAFELNEEFGRQYFANPRGLKEWQERNKCDVEFIY
jgi:hypothetical protein